MNRATLIFLGLLLFGLGVFLGMVGSFYSALVPKPDTTTSKHEARASRAVPPAVKPPTTAQKSSPKKAVVQRTATNAAASAETARRLEAELNQALMLLTSAVASQASPATEGASTNAVPRRPMQDFVPQPEATMMEPAAPAPTQPVAPDDALLEAPGTASAGHWTFDLDSGWVWVPESRSPVMTMPTVEVYPSGLVTIRSRPPPTRPGAPPKKAPPPPMPPGRPPQR